jgi:hypothetical protein
VQPVPRPGGAPGGGASRNRSKHRLIVNVCPAAVSSASPDRIWSVLTTLERFEEWQGARFVSAEPPGPIRSGQIVHLSAPSLGLHWPVTIDIGDIDPKHRWIDLVVHAPFGIENHEHVTLTPTKEGGSLVRFN